MSKAISLWGQSLYRQFSLMLGNQPKLGYYLHPLVSWCKPQTHPDHHSAAIVDFRWETDQMLSLWLEPASSWTGFKPGQHILVTLMHHGRYISRSFSISSSVAVFMQQNQIRISCRIQPKGEFTNVLAANRSEFTHLNISDAMGDFVMTPETKGDVASGEPVVMVAAGSGITPIWSMLSSMRCWTSPVVLFYCVKNAAQAAFLNELQQLAAAQPLFELQLIESRSSGRLDLVQQLTGKAGFVLTKAHYYFCGPAEMNRQFSASLMQQGVSSQSIHSEQFGLAVAVSEGPTKQALMTQQGKVTTVEAAAGVPLLHAAELKGLTPRFGCRIGVCYQCVCQKKSGQVVNLRTGQISGDGPEQIQLCISAAYSDLQIEL